MVLQQAEDVSQVTIFTRSYMRVRNGHMSALQLQPLCVCDERLRKPLEKEQNHCWCSASGAATGSFQSRSHKGRRRKEKEGSLGVGIGIGAGQL